MPQAFSQVEVSISPSTVGSGARAAGMADAFGAIADDATAASWNPAGLVQLEAPELSIVREWNRFHDGFKDKAPDGNSRNQRSNSAAINFASFTYPIQSLIASRNAVLSLSYQQRYDFTGDYNITQSKEFGSFVRDLDQVFEQRGQLGTLSPAFSIELTHTLSVGMAVNLWRNSPFSDNGWEQVGTVDAVATSIESGEIIAQTSIVETNEYENFEGENITVGILWNPFPKWNLSLRYDSAFKGDLDYTQTSIGTQIVGGTVITEEKLKMNLPDTWTLAVAYRANERLTLAVQMSRTDWNDFYIQFADGTRESLVDGNPLGDTDFDPTHSVRLGAEYVLLPNHIDGELRYLWSLRGGLIYDEEPASGRSTYTVTVEDADGNLKSVYPPGHGKPDRFYGIALGVGLQVFQRVNFDLAYQFRYGDDVNSDRITGLDGFSEDYRQHRVLFSSIVYF